MSYLTDHDPSCPCLGCYTERQHERKLQAEYDREAEKHWWGRMDPRWPVVVLVVVIALIAWLL